MAGSELLKVKTMNNETKTKQAEIKPRHFMMARAVGRHGPGEDCCAHDPEYVCDDCSAYAQAIADTEARIASWFKQCQDEAQEQIPKVGSCHRKELEQQVEDYEGDMFIIESGEYMQAKVNR